VQFTPDLLPGDIIGSPILEDQGGRRQLVFHQGPIFANLVLADEINRATPKTQSALLEAMQERRVTVLGETHPLPLPFYVLATQNPIELEGTYPLPEAQLDRFMFKINVQGVSSETLQEIITTRKLGEPPDLVQTLSGTELVELFRDVDAAPAGRGRQLHRPPRERHAPGPPGSPRRSAEVRQVRGLAARRHPQPFHGLFGVRSPLNEHCGESRDSGHRRTD
jgi:hypothetical protein